MTLAHAENINYVWAELVLGEIQRAATERGARSVVIACPGSRSSPLAITAHRRRESVELLVVTDERCAGFIALGAAMAGLIPVVIVTSGTAVANLLPAVVEASMSERPLIVLSADRPIELRACGANQTIEQAGIFRSFARWQFELPAPSDAVALAFVLSTANEAVQRATGSIRGPVHLNLPFREPLAPRRQAVAGLDDERIQRWATSTAPWRSSATPQRVVPLERVLSAGLSHATRGVVAVGADVESAHAARIAARLGWPIVADVASGVRGHAHRAWAAAVPDLVLAHGHEALHAALAPDLVLRLGGPISSKRINAYIASTPRTVVLRSGMTRFDETHTAHATFDGDLEPLAQALEATTPRWQRSSLLEPWLSAGQVAERAVRESLDQQPALIEPWIARTVVQALPETDLLLGNSMPIRDIDMHFPSDARVASIAVNRGASGIDGLVSTAVGLAMARRARRVAVVLGDLSLLHDLGGLANLARSAVPVHVIVINNDGGGIFDFLPVASEPSAQLPYEMMFSTPHGRTFGHAAAMFGIDYRLASNRSEAVLAMKELFDQPRSTLLECRTDRSTNVAVHRAIQSAVGHALLRGRGT